ncbi:Uncharacterized protein Fot_55495 [Forsythia ovata]|uniref:Uncharacterized protein n=1 Tax=Forsythia ovata TaxID=205694 RepID=A0ABD1P4A5_9LAMI
MQKAEDQEKSGCKGYWASCKRSSQGNIKWGMTLIRNPNGISNLEVPNSADALNKNLTVNSNSSDVPVEAGTTINVEATSCPPAEAIDKVFPELGENQQPHQDGDKEGPFTEVTRNKGNLKGRNDIPPPPPSKGE